MTELTREEQYAMCLWAIFGMQKMIEEKKSKLKAYEEKMGRTNSILRSSIKLSEIKLEQYEKTLAKI